MFRILIANDNPGVLQTLNALLNSEDVEVVPAESFDQARSAVDNERFDVMVVDLSIGEHRGLELVAQAQMSQKDLNLVTIAGEGTVQEALAALKKGIFDYLTKPIKPTEFLETIRHACLSKDSGASSELPIPLKHNTRLDTILAESASMRRVCDLIEQVAPTDVHLLVSGQGLEEIDRVIYTIHRMGSRHIKQMVTEDCRELTDESLFGREKKGIFKGSGVGALEAADGSLLHLPNIEDLSIELQEKLLVCLTEGRYQKGQDGPVVPLGARLVFSTSKDLMSRVGSGEFLLDLYNRISVVSIDVPTMANRQEDILPLIDYIAHVEIGYVGELSVTREVASYLEQHAWPGEMEELRKVVRYCLDRAENGTINLECLPQQVRSGGLSVSSRHEKDVVDFKLINLKTFLHKYQEECLARIVPA